MWTRVKNRLPSVFRIYFVGVCAKKFSNDLSCDCVLFFFEIQLPYSFLLRLIYFKNVYPVVNIPCSCVVYWYGCYTLVKSCGIGFVIFLSILIQPAYRLFPISIACQCFLTMQDVIWGRHIGGNVINLLVITYRPFNLIYS